MNSHVDKGRKAFKAVFIDFSNALIYSYVKGYAKRSLPHKLMKWVHNYFTGHSQYLRANNKVSSAIPNKFGVFQGAILSPFFFNFHNSDLEAAYPVPPPLYCTADLASTEE